MSKRILVFFIASLILQCIGKADSNIDWMKKEKIKASYTWMSKWHHKNPEKVVKDLQDAGFNSIFLKGTKDELQQKRWFDSATKNNIKLFIAFNYWSKGWKLRKEYRHAVYRTGKTCAAPCPMNFEYWENEILPRQLDLAKKSHNHKCIAGLLLDTEMYGIQPHAFLEDVCFCSSCFGKFMKKHKKTEVIAPEKRLQWLQTHKLLRNYYLYLEDEFTQITAKFRTKIHEQNPQLVLGNLNFINTWFFRGLLKGFGTKSVPAISAPESPTYRQGYIPFVEKQQRTFKRENFHIFFVPGIWNMCFYPEALARNCYKLAIHSDGYFDFTARALYGLIPQFTPTLMKKSNNDLKKYWDAFKYANEEISKKMKNRKYQSPLNKPPKNIASKVLSVQPVPLKGNPDLLLKNKGSKVTWNVDQSSDKVIMIIELNEKSRVKRIKVLCQGGGTPTGLYFPGKLQVYYTEYDGSFAEIDAKAKWASAGIVSKPDNPFSFAENGHHSLGAYKRWITVRTPIRSIDTKYVKIVFEKQSDLYAKKATKIGEEKVKQIQILKIEII